MTTKDCRIKTNLLVALLVVGLVLIGPLVTGCRSKDKSSEESSTSKFVNIRCPILGSPIDPAKVPDRLTRNYRGGKVAFCCGGCPNQWDKLSDEEKAAKLRKANAQP